MALYTEVKNTSNSYIIDNITQLIIPADHRLVNDAIIDACGAAQVYVFPGLSDNPGTPQNPRAYIALPGTYTNFGNLTVTAPLGVLKWDGSTWTVTQITIPSADNYFKCKTNAIITQGTSTTSIAVTMTDGGVTAKTGQWVKLTNRMTGRFDFVQLKADVAADATSISIVTRVIQQTLAAGSIVDFEPVLGMKVHGWTTNGDGANNYVQVPATWYMPPVEADDANVYLELLEVVINGLPCRWKETFAEVVSTRHYTIDPSIRRRVRFIDTLEGSDEVEIRYLQPIDLSVAS